MRSCRLSQKVRIATHYGELRGHITAQDIIFHHLSILDDFLWDGIYSANGAGDADGADVADSADGASKCMVRHSFRPHCNKLCFKKFYDVFYLWLFEDLATNLFLLDSFKGGWRILIKCSMKTTKTTHPKTNQRCVTVLHRNLLKCCVASLGWKGTRVSSMFNRQTPIDLSTQSLWPPKYLWLFKCSNTKCLRSWTITLHGTYISQKKHLQTVPWERIC